MMRSFFFVLLSACTLAVHAQFQITEPDKSPMDMSYFPQGYPILKFQTKTAPDKPKARVIYSRPQKNGRIIFGDVVKYNEVWRLGANESTEIEFFKDVTIAKKKVLKGRYTLYCIPQSDKWTIILNKDVDSWGAFSYKKDLDVLRADVPVAGLDAIVEYMTIVFDNSGSLVMAWDKVKAVLPIVYSK